MHVIGLLRGKLLAVGPGLQGDTHCGDPQEWGTLMLLLSRSWVKVDPWVLGESSTGSYAFSLERLWDRIYALHVGGLSRCASNHLQMGHE